MAESSPSSFFWFDFETTGIDPIRDRPMQFAGIRTDLDFNQIGEPIMFYCQLADDVLPHPDACLLTGISPQDANREGYLETDFMGKVEAQLSQPGTCALGYNTIRFDDEVVRHSFYRNFIDPYAREWQNNCSRWDIIDLVRLCYAMRPDGIKWPLREDGQPSLKLEDLTKANEIAHEQAHDALSDVYGTIEIARLIREKQPKLFAYYFKMRQKAELQKFIDPYRMKPFLHISGMFGAVKNFTAFVAPVAPHPTNKNGVILYDLMEDAQQLIDLSVEEIRHRVFSSKDELGNTARVPLKTLHYNRSPAIAPSTFLKDTEIVQRLALNGDICRQNLAILKSYPELSNKISQVFMQEREYIDKDPDLMLYSGGFFSREDKTRMQTIRECPPNELSELSLSFDDRRLPEMLMRYIGRNYPDQLNDGQRQMWDEYRTQRLMSPDSSGNITFNDYFARLNEIAQNPELSKSQQVMLQDLADYGQSIYPIQ